MSNYKNKRSFEEFIEEQVTPEITPDGIKRIDESVAAYKSPRTKPVTNSTHSQNRNQHPELLQITNHEGTIKRIVMDAAFFGTIEKFTVETETTKEASVEEIPTPEEDPEVETDEIPGEENEEFSTSWKRTYLVKACEIRNISKCKYLI